MTRTPAYMLPGDRSDDHERSMIRLVAGLYRSGDTGYSELGMMIRNLLLAGFAFMFAVPVFAQTPLDDARVRFDAIRSLDTHVTVPDSPKAVKTPSVSIKQVMAAPAIHDVKVVKMEKYLVSEPWCVNCPAAKRRFIAAGNPESHIIDTAEARNTHKQVFSSIPYEFQVPDVVTYRQPDSYRSTWPPHWDVVGVRLPTKEQLLKHLRTHENHKGKHWQEWYLESWKRDQLAALHDDDHMDDVPTFDGTPTMVVEVTNAPMNEQNILTAFSQAMEQYSTDPLCENVRSSCSPVMGSWFEYTLDVPDVTSKMLKALMKDKSYVNDTLGLKLNWPGKQVLTLSETSVSMNPPISLQFTKWKMQVSASISEFKFSPSYDSVTIITPEVLVPDVTINFK